MTVQHKFLPFQNCKCLIIFAFLSPLISLCFINTWTICVLCPASEGTSWTVLLLRVSCGINHQAAARQLSSHETLRSSTVQLVPSDAFIALHLLYGVLYLSIVYLVPFPMSQLQYTVRLLGNSEFHVENNLQAVRFTDFITVWWLLFNNQHETQSYRVTLYWNCVLAWCTKLCISMHRAPLLVLGALILLCICVPCPE